MFNQGPLGIALVDRDLRITNANPALCEFIGCEQSQLVGATIESFVSPDDMAEATGLARQMSDGTISDYQFETRFITSAGGVVFGSVTASMIRNEQGAAVYGLRIVEDLSRRKRLERELVAHATTAGKLLASLTPREAEILELLATGHTASKMAEHLAVSVRTVESHMANAYRKLGVRSREDAAAELARLKLAVGDVQLTTGKQVGPIPRINQ